MALIYLLLALISFLPCFVITFALSVLLRPRYTIKPLRLTLLSGLLALVSGFVFNVELDGGLLSFPVAVSLLSGIWAMLLLGGAGLYQAFSRRKVILPGR
ncbi:hypothetical protein [Gallaecimonas pentaromativorans]|uniref:Uncharacterized protein n=1 Tax=Gallaecimonas pentaromativorans TaxID=584787 RepID=A0A3N1P0V1_9GAMM|nr:hypothetical protein [Gallaecimonas pentaromativorans]ROQ24892.1 hypothetical protein EDC28_106139 [Gallaecimonas pentaromativorans]